jgi:predicted homoserine dehydrogenase-like protein
LRSAILREILEDMREPAHTAARTQSRRKARSPVGLIGAGKFGTMFLAQARLTEGLHVVGVADLNVRRARDQLKTADGRRNSTRRRPSPTR